jgi:hypothetical protein
MPLHAAITGKEPEKTTKYLLTFSKEILDMKDLSGVSPLFLATYTGNQ